MSGYFFDHLSASNDPSGLAAIIGNEKDYLTTRVAYKLDLKGARHHGSNGLFQRAGGGPYGLSESAQWRMRRRAGRRDGHPQPGQGRLSP